MYIDNVLKVAVSIFVSESDLTIVFFMSIFFMSIDLLIDNITFLLHVVAFTPICQSFGLSLPLFLSLSVCLSLFLSMFLFSYIFFIRLSAHLFFLTVPLTPSAACIPSPTPSHPPTSLSVSQCVSECHVLG